MTKYTLVKFPEVRYGDLTAPTVLAGQYSFSVGTSSARQGAILRSRTFDDVGSPHELNGTVYPTVEEARQAGFEAGLIGYYVKS